MQRKKIYLTVFAIKYYIFMQNLMDNKGFDPYTSMLLTLRSPN